MHADLPAPVDGALFYEDSRAYATLANHPIARGHTVVVWKKHVPDLHLLKKADYKYLMDLVDAVRNTLLTVLKIKKVYLIYMDEANHVHWHLIPRYNLKGFNALMEKPVRQIDVALSKKLGARMKRAWPST